MGLINAFDSANYPRREPLTLQRGARWAWRRDDLLSAYPSASYSWRWVARPEDGISQQRGELAIAGSESGGAVLFEAGQSTTAAYVTGRYVWQLQVTRTSDSEVVTVDSGVVTVTADADDTTDAATSFARQHLRIVEAALLGNTSPEVQSYSVGGRSLSRYSKAELMDLRQRLRHEVAAEDRAALAAAGRHTGMRIRTRFCA